METTSPITVLEKPEWISFDDIHNILWKANEENRKNGFVLKTSNLLGEQLKARLGNDGKCFVALDNDRLVGTISVGFVKCNTWYAKGLVANYKLAAVIPEYQGKHINTLLSQKVFDSAKEKGCSVIVLDTAENNSHAIAVYKHMGFELIGYKAITEGDHYSVIMAKWLHDDRPFSAFYCRLRFLVKKSYVRLRFTCDNKKRFGI